MSKKNTIYYLFNTSAMVLFMLIACHVDGLPHFLCSILISVLLGMQVLRYHYGLLFPSISLLLLVPFVAITGTNTQQMLGQAGFMYLAIYALNFAMPMVLMGLTLGFSFKLKVGFHKTVLILAAISLVSTLIDMKVLGSVFPERVSLEGALSIATEQTLATLSELYKEQPQLIQMFESTLGMFTRLILILSPAIFTVVSLIFSYICFVVFQWFIKKRGFDTGFWPSFSELRADKVCSVLFLILIGAFFLISDGLASDVIVNVVLILNAVFLLFGLSMIDWKLKMSGTKKLTRCFILILAPTIGTLIFPFLLLVIIGIGVLDGLFDYRNKDSNRAGVL